MTPESQVEQDYGLKAINLFCFILFFLAFFRTYRLTTYLTYQDILILGGFIFACFLNSEYLRSNLKFLLAVILLTIALAIATTANSVDLFGNYQNILKLVHCFFFFPSLCLMVLRTPSSIKSAILGFLSGALVSSIFVFQPDQLLVTQQGLRVDGTLGHPVFSGVMLSFAIILASSSFLNEIRGWKPIRILLISIFLIVVLRTQSGTALFALGLALFAWVTYYLLSEVRLIEKILLVTSSCFGVIILGFTLENLPIFQRVIFNITSTRTSSFIPATGESTLEIRLQTLYYAWERIKEAPFLGNGLDLPGQFNYSGMQPHSIFLLAWQTGGILLLLGSIIFFFDGIGRMVKSGMRRSVVPLALFMATWVTLFSSPIFYEASFMSAYYLGISMLRIQIKML
jgi:hypothetical protein